MGASLLLLWVALLGTLRLLHVRWRYLDLHVRPPSPCARFLYLELTLRVNEDVRGMGILGEGYLLHRSRVSLRLQGTTLIRLRSIVAIPRSSGLGLTSFGSVDCGQCIC